jgi:hypothetical protein
VVRTGTRAGRADGGVGPGTARARPAAWRRGAPVRGVRRAGSGGSVGPRPVSRARCRLRSACGSGRASSRPRAAGADVPVRAPSARGRRPPPADGDRAGAPGTAASLAGRDHAPAVRSDRTPGAAGGAHPAAARQPGALLRSPSGRVRCGARPSSPPPDRNGPTPRVPSVGPSSTRSPTPVASQRSLVPAGISGPT